MWNETTPIMTLNAKIYVQIIHTKIFLGWSQKCVTTLWVMFFVPDPLSSGPLLLVMWLRIRSFYGQFVQQSVIYIDRSRCVSKGLPYQIKTFKKYLTENNYLV